MADSFREDSFREEADAPQRDLIGQIKARLTQHPEKPYSVVPEAADPAAYMRSLVPGSWPAAAAAGASLIPGAGVLGTLGRTAAAGGGAAGIEALRGGDPSTGALKAGGMTLGGETLGGLGRAGARMIGARLDPIKEKLAAAIGIAVPAYKGLTPQSTLAKAMSDEGQRALSREYGDAVEAALKQAGGAWHNMYTQAKAAGVPDALNKIMGMMPGGVPGNVQTALAKANAEYAAGKAVHKLVQGTRLPTGELDVPELQNRLFESGGALRARVPNYQAFEEAIRRGEVNPLKSDLPGVTPHIGVHIGPVPHPRIYAIPQAPRPIGRPEEQSELVAQSLRRLGVLGAGSAME